MLGVEALDVKHFSIEGRDYLIASSQVTMTIETNIQIFIFNVTIITDRQRLLVGGILNFWLNLISLILQIFVWVGGSLLLHQTLDFKQGILSVTPFTRANTPYLLVCLDGQNATCFLLQWTSGRFQNSQPLPLSGRASQVEAINRRTEETLLLVAIEGDLSCFDMTFMNVDAFMV